MNALKLPHNSATRDNPARATPGNKGAPVTPPETAPEAARPEATRPRPDLDRMMAEWRAIAGDVTHLSLKEQQLHLEVRQANHAHKRTHEAFAAYKVQSEETLHRLQEELTWLQAVASERDQLRDENMLLAGMVLRQPCPPGAHEPASKKPKIF